MSHTHDTLQKTSANKSIADQVKRKASAKKNTNAIAPGIQLKLTIGQPDDVYEREADRVADKVMGMPSKKTVQRECKDCEKEEKISRKPLAASIQKKGSDGNTQASDSVTAKISATRGRGSRMDESSQSFMSERFGSD